jgi:hypothetical protein
VSSGQVAVVRCDMPKCQTFARLPLDHPRPNDRKALQELLAAAGWHQYSYQGMVTYTADYCPDHKKATSEGIRGWAGNPTPISERVEAGLVVHRARRQGKNAVAA